MTSAKKIQQRKQICVVSIGIVTALALIIGVPVGLNEMGYFDARECPIGVTGWCEWSQWSSCTHSCGNGQKNRLRSCSNEQGVIERRSNGNRCEGDAFEVTPCNEGQCQTGLRVVTETARNLRERLDLEDNLFLDRYAHSVTNHGQIVNVNATVEIGYGIWRLTEVEFDEIYLNITVNNR